MHNCFTLHLAITHAQSQSTLNPPCSAVQSVPRRTNQQAAHSTNILSMPRATTAQRRQQPVCPSATQIIPSHRSIPVHCLDVPVIIFGCLLKHVQVRVAISNGAVCISITCGSTSSSTPAAQPQQHSTTQHQHCHELQPFRQHPAPARRYKPAPNTLPHTACRPTAQPTCALPHTHSPSTDPKPKPSPPVYSPMSLLISSTRSRYLMAGRN